MPKPKATHTKKTVLSTKKPILKTNYLLPGLCIDSCIDGVYLRFVTTSHYSSSINLSVYASELKGKIIGAGVRGWLEEYATTGNIDDEESADRRAVSIVVDTLNEAFKADPEAIIALVGNRVSCNNELVKHPTIVVGGNRHGNTLGAIGLMNGFIERLSPGWRLALVYPDQRPRSKPLGFVATKIGAMALHSPIA